MLGLIFEAGDGGACFEDLIDLRAEGLRQIAEFQVAGLAFSAAEILRAICWREEWREIAADDDASTAEFAEDARHHFMVAGQLTMQPDVFKPRGRVARANGK